MDIRDGLIGSTPLLKLQSFSQRTGCNIPGKAKFFNLGGPVKGCAARYIIRVSAMPANCGTPRFYGVRICRFHPGQEKLPARDISDVSQTN